MKTSFLMILLGCVLLLGCAREETIPSQIQNSQNFYKKDAASITPSDLYKEEKAGPTFSGSSRSASTQTGKKSVRSLFLKKVRSFQEPVYITQPKGTPVIFVVEKRGVVWQKKGGRWSKYLDIRKKVKNSGEQGLLSMAPSPSWKKDRLFYVYYTARSGRQIVAEGESTKGRASIRRTVLSMPDFAPNHNGGALAYYKGLLYISTGDGGGGGDPERTSQNKNSLLGKILRIDPRSPGGYLIPKGNSYAQGGGRPEIFALGLRNPWRFSFGGDKIWIADVGEASREEVNALSVKKASGANFGWSAYEGEERYNEDQEAAPHTKPIFTYGRSRGCSITGGYFVESKKLSSLRGKYVYADLCKRNLRALVIKKGRVVREQILPIRVDQTVSFGNSNSGKLWVVSILGDIYEIRER